MKIKCEYCGAAFNDTLETCPSCGASNPNVRRTEKGHPKTIEELKEWYKSKSLPPYETTRFFIGQNYQKPKAVGIYKDEKSGNFIVYKNKASGERAIRYEGTDEAYAVNEIFMKLKEEIIRQKMNKVNKGTAAPSRTKSYGSGSKKSGGLWQKIQRLPLTVQCIISALIIGLFILLIIFIIGFSIVITEDKPKSGYYLYDSTYYYCSDSHFDSYDNYWACLENGEWEYFIKLNKMPDEMTKNKTAKKYLLSKQYEQTSAYPDFSQSVCQKDIEKGAYSDIGYYISDNTTYYHYLGHYSSEWYKYDTDWEKADFDLLPHSLKHPSLSHDDFVSAEWSDTLSEASDFKNTVWYDDLEVGSKITKGYYKYEDDYYYHPYGSIYDNWYLYDSDTGSWQKEEVYDIPSEMQHPSIADDFYYTPDWDTSLGISDFRDSGYYSDSSSSYSDDDDSWNSYDDDDYSWDWDFGDDDWDYDYGDWDSDW